VLVGVLNGGIAAGCIAPEASMLGDVRTLPDMTRETVYDDLKKLVDEFAVDGCTYKIKLTAVQKSFVGKKESTLMTALSNSYKKVRGSEIEIITKMPTQAFVTDTADMSAIGLEALVFGPGDWKYLPDEFISIKDMVGKLIGVIVTILYVLDGSIKTMNSMWNGPPGQMVKVIGSCFHPETKIKVKSGETYSMKDLPLGVELEDGSKVFSVLKVDNPEKLPLYKINNGVNNEPIYVTGEHFILDPASNKFIQVKNYKDAKLLLKTEMYSNWFSCIITTNRRIKINNHIFWDWEDDELTN
jgi:hypothetical protein